MSYTKTFIPFPPLIPPLKRGFLFLIKNFVFSEKEYKIKA